MNINNDVNYLLIFYELPSYCRIRSNWLCCHSSCSCIRTSSSRLV